MLRPLRRRTKKDPDSNGTRLPEAMHRVAHAARPVEIRRLPAARTRPADVTALACLRARIKSAEGKES